MVGVCGTSASHILSLKWQGMIQIITEDFFVFQFLGFRKCLSGICIAAVPVVLSVDYTSRVNELKGGKW